MIFFWCANFFLATILVLFLNRVSRGINKKIWVIFFYFSITYFIFVPITNIYTDTYIQKSLFIWSPENSFAALAMINGFGLVFSYIGSMWRVKSFSGKDVDVSSLKRIIIIFFIIGFSLAIYNNFIIKNLISEGDSPYASGKKIYLYMITESTPLLFAWIVILWQKDYGRIPKPSIGLIIIVSHFLIVVACNFSRGSRVSMLAQLIFGWILFNGVIYRYKFHHYVIVFGLISLTLPIYAFYKYSGKEALIDYIENQKRNEIVDQFNNPAKFIVGDIGRSDIQAPILIGLLEGKYTPTYYPETYLSALMLLLPQQLRPDYFRSKVLVGADAQLKIDPNTPLAYGDSGEGFSSRIYALLGECLLNFGLYGVPFVFFIFGILVRLSFKLASIDSMSGVLFRPLFVILPIYMLFFDVENIVFQVVVVWFVPYLAYLLSKVKY